MLLTVLSRLGNMDRDFIQENTLKRGCYHKKIITYRGNQNIVVPTILYCTIRIGSVGIQTVCINLFKFILKVCPKGYFIQT